VERGEKTLLMKGDAGAFAPLHAHAEFEQIYVLEARSMAMKGAQSGDYCSERPERRIRPAPAMAYSCCLSTRWRHSKFGLIR